MKKSVLLFILMVEIILLSGCGPIYQTNYAYQPPRSEMGKMCTNQCLQAKNTCEQMCQMQDRDCRMQEHQDAFYRYEAYRDRQKSEGKSVDRSIDDFDRSSYVCDHPCHCTPNFNLCYQNCGGVVLEQKVCTAFCN